jgi:hypothetical protein
MQGFLTWLDALLPMEQWIGLISVISMIVFGISLWWVVYIIGKIPADFFMKERKELFKDQSFRVRYFLFGLNNFLGFLLIIMGIIMLVAPGQGLLTILMGLAIMSFPGKRKLEIRLLRIRFINRSLNWIRQKKGLADIQIP